MSREVLQTLQREEAFPYAKNRILVKLRDGVSEGTRSGLHTRMQATSVKQLGLIHNLYLVGLPREISVRQALEAYRLNPDVLYAEPDYILRALEFPNDPFFIPYQWNLHNTGQEGGTPGADIRALEAWNIATGDQAVVVAIIDTGIQYSHMDLSANLWRNEKDCDRNGFDDDLNGYIDDCHGIDVVNDDSDPMDDHGHGTHVSGIIGAVGNNGVLISGINWKVSMMACKFLDSEGVGTVSGAIECLDYVAKMRDRGIHIIATNNSYGGGGFSQAFWEAINAHRKRGILFIVAAGNERWNNDWDLTFPSGYNLPNVISVAATDRFDDLAFYSNEGRHTVHVGAPGTDVLSTIPTDAYEIQSGTSMATPHVTAVTALLRAQDPLRDWKEIRNLILSSGDELPSLSNTISQRRLNAYRSLACPEVTLLSRLLPHGKAIYAQVGTPLLLSVLHIRCSRPNGEIEVHIEPGNQVLQLRDDGSPPDEEAEDGIYSGQWIPPNEGIFILTFPGNDPLAVRAFSSQLPPLFRPFAFYDLGNTFAEAVSVGDLNGDGRNDIAVVTSPYNDPENDQRLHVFSQSSTGELERGGKYLIGDLGSNARIPSVDIGDLNNDGRPDVAVTSMHPLSEEENFIGVFLQNEAGTFEPLVRYPTPNSQRMRIGDLNQDGLLDVVSVGCWTNTIDLFYQTPYGTLAPPMTYEIVHGCDSQVEIGDVNNDGLQDIVVINGRWETTPNFGILLQRLDGTFSPPLYYAIRGGMPTYGVAVGDIDGDGRQDIALGSGGGLSLFLQNEVGDLNPPLRYPSWWDSPTALKIVDINGDGRNDILGVPTSSGVSNLSIHLQAPNGAFFPYLLQTVPFMNFNPQGMAVGDLNGDGMPDVVTADANYGLAVLYNDPQGNSEIWTLTIVKEGNGHGRVVSDPPGIDCGSICTAVFNNSTYIRLTAIPEPNSIFTGWRSKFCKEEATGACMLVIQRNDVVQADFDLRSVRLTVIPWGSGRGVVKSDPPGIDCGTDCEEDYPNHAQVTLTAIPDEDSQFVSWSGEMFPPCFGSEPCSIVMEFDSTVRARFDLKTVILAVEKSGTGSGIVTSSPPGINCGSDCSESYPLGITVTLIAIPNPGSIFVGWGGDCTGSGSCSLEMVAPKKVTATFITHLRIDSDVLSDGEVGVSYHALLEISGGLPPYRLSISRGALPEGLGFDSDGSIRGTPLKGDISSFAVHVEDVLGSSLEKPLKIRIFKALTITTKDLRTAGVGKNYQFSLKAKNGKKPFQWTLLAGSLPEGLALESASGKLKGLPLTPGSFPLTIQARDVLGGQSSKEFRLTVEPQR